MYSNYTGRSSRSKSTTDVSQLDDYQHHPFTTSLPINSGGGTLHRRRRQTNPFAPAPPRRTDSINDLESIKRSRSYLTDGLRKEFESSTINVENQSPRSNNFVKKLVASLERRQREIGFLGNNGFGGKEEVFKKNPREVKNDAVVRDDNRVPVHQPTVVEVERYDSGLTYSRVPPTRQLEDLQENDDEFSSSSSDDFFPSYWDYERTKSVSIVKSSPIPAIINHQHHQINNNNNNNVNQKNDEETSSPSLKSTARRTLKNMLSSIKNWKLGKTLPKGTRDYYATRESLGEEMRAFRRDTMPKLVEKAVVKNHLQDNNENHCKDEQREFTEMIGRGRFDDSDDLTRRPIATIHPVYGNKNGLVMHNRFNTRYQEKNLVDEEKNIEEEVVYRPKIQSPPVKQQQQQPPAIYPKTTSSSRPIEDHVLRPSKLRDLQKRLSQEIDALAALQLQQNKPQMRTSVVYDIPRSNRNVIDEENEEDEIILQQHTPPEYENIGCAINDDKRLRCMFTTF